MITERAMLAAVHISIWTAVKHDRKVSREVAEQHGAHAGAGRYNKKLCAKRISWSRFVRSRGKSVNTSTKSHCPGLTRVIADSPPISISS